MVTPLQYGDPPHLGPIVLHARLMTAPAGLVYLGQAPDGRAVSVAVLTAGAALDGAARDRFVTAIKNVQRHQHMMSGPRGWWTASLVDRAGARTAVDLPPIVAMHDGEAPWVAVPYVPGRPGAERFLDPVMVSGMLAGQRQGPEFVPYWLGDVNPALPAPPRPAPPPVATRRAVVLASALLSMLVLVLAVVLWLLLFRGFGERPPAQPLPATNFVPTPPPEPTTPEPTPSTPAPGGSPTPAPPGAEDEGEPI